MPILSPEFALFFLFFLLLYWSFQKTPKIQNGLLLVANLGLLYYVSYLFALSILGYSLLMTFFGYRIQAEKSKAQRKTWLLLGVSLAVGILAFFKYFDYFRPSLYELGYNNVADIVMPLGLSYYVFQSIAYIVGIYRGIAPALRFGELLLHFSFFLTITAGPIIRADRFKSIDGNNLGATEQIRRPKQLLHPALAVSLILLGAAKAWWFSASIATEYVNPVFGNPMQYGVAELLLAVYGYTLQLFFDFSGYSDLVIGLAMLLGYRLPWNFRAPLYAVNIRDFWARWHITLTTWIRDYVYIPLGGNRQGFFRTQVNLLIAFILSGIWHGNTLNFLIWGAMHGFALVFLNIKQQYWTPAIQKLTTTKDKKSLTAGKKPRQQTPQLSTLWWAQIKRHLAIFITFNFVCLTFVFFKIESFAEVNDFFNALFHGSTASHWLDWLLIIVLFIGIFCYPQWVKFFQGLVSYLHDLPLTMWFVIITLILQLIIICAPAGIPGFIYANF